MCGDLPTDDNLCKNLSNDLEKDNNSHNIEMAAEQIADLLWDHWLYIQKQKNKDRLDKS